MQLRHLFKLDAPIIPTWVKSHFKEVNAKVNECNWYNIARSKYSLNNYVMFKNSLVLEEYLLDKSDFYGASLKFKARSNTLPLNGRIPSWTENMIETCALCKNGIEDLSHFLFTCGALNDVRTDELLKLERHLLENNLHPLWQNFMASDLESKMCIMLGTPVMKIMVTFLIHFVKVILNVLGMLDHPSWTLSHSFARFMLILRVCNIWDQYDLR